MIGVRHCLPRLRVLEIRLHTLQTSLRSFEIMGALSKPGYTVFVLGFVVSALGSLASSLGFTVPALGSDTEH